MVVVLETDNDEVIWQLCQAVIAGQVETLYKVPDNEVAFLRPDIRQPLRVVKEA